MTLSTRTRAPSRSSAYERPAARFTGSGLDVRASALGQCRRALWYAATGQPETNPMNDETRLVLEAGQALEPVVVRAMQRRFWTVTHSDPEQPWRVEVEAGAGLTVSGHPDAVGAVELFGEEGVIEVKTRGPEAFKRWQTLGAERSHPESVAQAACYSLGLYGEVRDIVIATLDTGSRQWDYELIPAQRAQRAWDAACLRLSALAEHHEACGPDPEALPERDFTASDWQCKRCPYLNRCQPGEAVVGQAGEADEDDLEPAEPVSDQQAQAALREYEQAQSQIKASDQDKRSALKTLQRWLERRGEAKARLEGAARTRTIGMVASRRYSVDHKRLNALLDPEQRAEIVTEQVSEYVRVS
jgi:hypothetical protein